MGLSDPYSGDYGEQKEQDDAAGVTGVGTNSGSTVTDTGGTSGSGSDSGSNSSNSNTSNPSGGYGGLGGDDGPDGSYYGGGSGPTVTPPSTADVLSPGYKFVLDPERGPAVPSGGYVTYPSAGQPKDYTLQPIEVPDAYVEGSSLSDRWNAKDGPIISSGPADAREAASLLGYEYKEPEHRTADEKRAFGDVDRAVTAIQDSLGGADHITNLVPEVDPGLLGDLENASYAFAATQVEREAINLVVENPDLAEQLREKEGEGWGQNATEFAQRFVPAQASNTAMLAVMNAMDKWSAALPGGAVVKFVAEQGAAVFVPRIFYPTAKGVADTVYESVGWEVLDPATGIFTLENAGDLAPSWVSGNVGRAAFLGTQFVLEAAGVGGATAAALPWAVGAVAATGGFVAADRAIEAGIDATKEYFREVAAEGINANFADGLTGGGYGNVVVEDSTDHNTSLDSFYAQQEDRADRLGDPGRVDHNVVVDSNFDYSDVDSVVVEAPKVVVPDADRFDFASNNPSVQQASDVDLSAPTFTADNFTPPGGSFAWNDIQTAPDQNNEDGGAPDYLLWMMEGRHNIPEDLFV